jgi:hypothetical protein
MENRGLNHPGNCCTWGAYLEAPFHSVNDDIPAIPQFIQKSEVVYEAAAKNSPGFILSQAS